MSVDLLAVDGTRCTGCGACLRTCPQHAVRPGEHTALVVVHRLCDGCGECIEVCPTDAVVQVSR